jgi:hypothetical protein
MDKYVFEKKEGINVYVIRVMLHVYEYFAYVPYVLDIFKVYVN